MAFNQATTLFDFSTKLGTFTQQTAWKWYKASKEVEDFKWRATEVRFQYEHWTSLLLKYNIADPEIESRLASAIRLLDEEDQKASVQPGQEVVHNAIISRSTDFCNGERF